MALQNRENAVQGQWVRLYCRFFWDGQIADPASPPIVEIVTNDYAFESSSSSEDLSTSSEVSSESSMSSQEMGVTGYGPFYATRERTGLWFIDWWVPDNLATGDWYDHWKFVWSGESILRTQTMKFVVYPAKTLIDFVSPPSAYRISDTMASMINDLANVYIRDATNIPIHWEQAQKLGDRRTLRTTFGNWRQDPKPMLRKNNQLMLTGWNCDYNGLIKLERPHDPEDHYYVDYTFNFFSNEELMGLINQGLQAMNTVPPASQSYYDVGSSPYTWRFPILLYAGMQAIRRILFSFTYQERAIIYAEKPADLGALTGIYQDLYKGMQEQFNKAAEQAKTLRLPGIAQISVPEYTLPGGRSRWARYLFKGI